MYSNINSNCENSELVFFKIFVLESLMSPSLQREMWGRPVNATSTPCPYSVLLCADLFADFLLLWISSSVALSKINLYPTSASPVNTYLHFFPSTVAAPSFSKMKNARNRFHHLPTWYRLTDTLDCALFSFQYFVPPCLFSPRRSCLWPENRFQRVILKDDSIPKGERRLARGAERGCTGGSSVEVFSAPVT